MKRLIIEYCERHRVNGTTRTCEWCGQGANVLCSRYGHNAEVSWLWNYGCKGVSAVFECKNCDFVDEVYVPADQIKDEITEWATGTHTFTAKVNYQGIEYSTSKKWREGLFAARSISLGGDVGLLHYLGLTDAEAKGKIVRFDWSVIDGQGNEVKKTHTSELEKDDALGLYAAMCPIPATEMIYGVDASITLGKDTFSEVFSVAEYAEIIMTDEAFAQQYVASENAAGRDGEKCGYTEKDGLIYFEKRDIAAPEFDTLFTLKIGDGEYRYSVLDYVRECLLSSETAESLKDLSKATYRFNKATDAFFDAESATAKAATAQAGGEGAGAASVQAEGEGDDAGDVGGLTAQAEGDEVVSVQAVGEDAGAEDGIVAQAQDAGANADEYETQLLGARSTSTGTPGTGGAATTPTGAAAGSGGSSGTTSSGSTKLASTGDNTPGMAVAALLLAAASAGALGVATRRRS